MKQIAFIVLGAIGLCELILLFFFNPSEVHFFVPCFFYLLTGFRCPGCGTQRSIHHLFHGHIVEAFWLCPFLYFFILVVLVIICFPRVANKLWFALLIVGLVMVYAPLRMTEIVP